MENPSTEASQTHPFARLDPQMVLEAVESVGLYGDGRLLALNSYENRVYQIGLEEGAPVVVKFYRPARWTDAAILEDAPRVQSFCRGTFQVEGGPLSNHQSTGPGGRAVHPMHGVGDGDGARAT